MTANGTRQKALLDITVCLFRIIRDNDFSEGRDLLAKTAREGLIQEVCMADATRKQKWLEHIPKTLANYSHYQYIASAVDGEVPVLEVIKKNKIAILALMLEYGVDVNAVNTEKEGWPMTPLEAAVQYKNSKAAMLLLKAGADPLKRNCLLQTPLTAALQSGKKEFVRFLLNATKGVEIGQKDTFGKTPLLRLLSRPLKDEDPDILRTLLHYGSKINVKDKHSGMYPIHTVLHYYSGTPTTKAIQILLQKRADPNVKTTSGKTALHMVCSQTSKTATKEISHRKKYLIVTMLLQHGANPSECDKNFNTPLHLAAKLDLPKVAELLIEHHANVLKRNVDGYRPSDLAGSHSAVRRMLEEAFNTLSPFSSAATTPVLDRAFSPFSEFYGSTQSISKPDKLSKWNECEQTIGSFERSLTHFVNSVEVHLHHCRHFSDTNSDDGLLNSQELELGKCSDILGDFSQLKGMLNQIKPSTTSPELKRTVSVTSMSSVRSTHLGGKAKSTDDILLYKAFQTVSSTIGQDWKSLFRELDPCDPLQCESLIQELESQHPGQLREQAYQALAKWKTLNGKEANIQRLKISLKQCHLQGTLDMLRDRLEQLQIDHC